MKLRVRNLWVAALRSGKYKQGIGKLKRADGGYCCLGVLTHLYAKQHGVRFDRIAKKSTCELLPEQVQEWAELETEDPRINGKCLSRLNDGECQEGIKGGGKTFIQIADLIEKHL